MVSVPEQILESLQNDLPLYEDYLRKVGRAVMENGISRYPIFIAHREAQIGIGRPIVLAELMQSQWSINASVLEEMVRKGIVNRNKVEHFKEIYKSPMQHACLFVISGESDAGFAFYPYRTPTSQQ